VEDSAEGVIKFKNNVLAGFYTINYYGYDAPVEIELYCEKATAKMVGNKATILFNDGKILESKEDNSESMYYGKSYKSYWGISHIKQITEHYNMLAQNKKPPIDGEYGLKTQRMISAIYNSGKVSKRIYF
jgi:predicted dehydrogenase